MTRPSPLDRVADTIAGAFLAGEWEPGGMAERAGVALGDGRIGWLTDLALVIIRAFRSRPADAPRELASVIRRCDALLDRWAADFEGDDRPPWETKATLTPTAMGAARWPVVPLDTVGDLADLLGLHPSRLAWYADVRSLERTAADEQLRHYRYRWLAKRAGGARLIESPKPMLKLFQRRILHEILDPIPAHDAAHGFRPGRSVHTFVAPHVGREAVIRIDLEGFFASVRAGRVFATLRTAGYPEPVAHCLTGLMTNAVPRSVLRSAPTSRPERLASHRRALLDLSGPHLPQGAPTSPALANLAAHRLDIRLSGLAASFDATYTRYADDLAFSGRRRMLRSHRELERAVADIARSEGFRVNTSKTRVIGASSQQRLGGLVINDRPNVDRRTYDQLKAVLHDAATNGPAVANRSDLPEFRAHLLGRLSWVEAANPTRGARLRAQFDRIEWTAPTPPVAQRSS